MTEEINGRDDRVNHRVYSDFSLGLRALFLAAFPPLALLVAVAFPLDAAAAASAAADA